MVFDPKYLLDITFPQGNGKSIPLKAGMQLSLNGTKIQVHRSEQRYNNCMPTETSQPPNIAVSGQVTRLQRFVVTMLDLDAPTPEFPRDAQVRHLLAGNFVRTVASHDDPKELMLLTRPVSRWYEPNPPMGSDPHRYAVSRLLPRSDLTYAPFVSYVFLMFEQPREFLHQQLLTPQTPITSFNISDFAQKIGLGNPVAGTYMLVGPDLCEHGFCEPAWRACLTLPRQRSDEMTNINVDIYRFLQ